jgi:iron complex transport system substrate-binding protein
LGFARLSSLLALLCLAASLAAAPRRVVSMNPCADAVLAAVAAPSQIAGLSHWSRDPAASSMAVAVARRYPRHFGTAEEVLALKPDLVIAGAHTPAATRTAFRRLGVPVLTVGVPGSVAASLAEVRAIAAAVGRPAAGEALVQAIERAIPAHAPPPRTAILRTQAGVVPGDGTLAAELMARAGLANAAPALGLAPWDVLPVERLLLDPPDVLLAEPRAQLHQALRRLAAQPGGRMQVAPFSMRLLNCGGPSIVPAVAAMARARAMIP